MRIAVLISLVFTIITSVALAGLPPPDPKLDADLTKKIEKSLDQIQQIRVGMSRADLSKVFTKEGGISTRKSCRYVYRACPYIHVDVEFVPVGEKDGADKITKISQPFLALLIID